MGKMLAKIFILVLALIKIKALVDSSLQQGNKIGSINFSSFNLQNLEVPNSGSSFMISFLNLLPNFLKMQLLTTSTIAEPIIWQIVQKKDWFQVLEYSKIIYKKGASHMSYKIWYYKALAQFALFQIEQSKNSWMHASESIKQDSQFYHNITKMKRLLDLFEIKDKGGQQERQKEQAKLI